MKSFLLYKSLVKTRACFLCLLFVGNTSLWGNSNSGNVEALIITSAEDLRVFAVRVNRGDSFKGKIVKLADNIWLNDTIGWKIWDRESLNLKTWIPIGEEEHPFEGVFDGGGYYIAGMFTQAGSESFYQGLFGYLKNAIIKNIHIRYSHLVTSNFAGAIAGYICMNTLIEGCSNEGMIESNRNYIGGIIGFSEGQNSIINCFNGGKIYGHRCVGGIVGFFEGGSIYNVYNKGEIVGRYEHVGGIVGEYSEPYHKAVKGTGFSVLPNDTLANCYNIGVIAGRDAIGGIAGHISLYPNDVTTIKVLIANNYSVGKLVSHYPIITDGLIGVYAYFSDSNKLVIPTVNRIERDGAACYWSEEPCKVISIDKPRFESAKIRSDVWNTVCYGTTKIPSSFLCFLESDMKTQMFVDLLNIWVVKEKGPFARWIVDQMGKNQGFPIFYE